MGRSLTILHRVVMPVSALLLLGPALAWAASTDKQARAQLAELRLPFIANEGQVDAKVAYYAPTFAGTLFVTQSGELVYSLPNHTVDAPRGRPHASASPGWSLTEQWVGGRARPVASDRSETRVSYFLGSDAVRWRPDVPTYEQVSLGEVWPGVTVALRAHGRSVEKVFTVSPGASVDRIRVRVSGASRLSVDPQGALAANTGLGSVTFTAPIAYQERDGTRRPVSVTYRLKGREYRFTVGTYDPSLPLVIDPLLQSTYLGGVGSDDAFALAIAPATGHVYVAGNTSSINFPGTAGGAQSVHAGGVTNAFVARLNRSLTALIQATYLGGGPAHAFSSDSEVAYALAIAPTTGEVYVAGSTHHINFPGTTGGAQAAFGGGGLDGFVARLNSSLTSLLQATYLGGGGVGGVDKVFGLAISPPTGDVYVAGRTASTNFPGTVGGAQPLNRGGGDAFVAHLNDTLTSLLQATYLGGSGFDTVSALAISPTTGDVYVAGRTTSPTDFPGTTGGAQATFGGGVIDGFVARFPGSLTTLTQATYLGGSNDDQVDALALAPMTGDVYVAGYTLSTNFPGTTGGAQSAFGGGLTDGFVARLTSSLTTLTQATYLGGSGADPVRALAIAPTTGNVYVAGVTESQDFPGTSGGAQAVFGGGGLDAFVARLTLSLALATFSDVPPTHPFFRWIETLFGAGITGGCSTTPLQYCPDDGVTRGQMAVFLLRGMHGAGYQPPAATGVMFTDVPATQPFAKWIEQLAREGITGGCSTSPPQYCPDDGVTRGQMAVFLLRAKHGAGYAPPAATGTMFTDVPGTHPFAAWIEQLAREGITGGCSTSPPQYCPDATVTRGQMAVFLVRAFDLLI